MLERLGGMARRVEFPVLLAGFCIASGLWGFFELAEVARNATPHDFDTDILLAFREAGRPDDPLGPPWLEEAVRDVTALGSFTVLTLLVSAAVIYLLMAGKRFEALTVFVAVGGGQVLSSLLKLGIDRPRPDLVAHLAEVQTLSFPSGHAMLAAVTYLTLGSLLARSADTRRTKAFFLSFAVLLALMIGMSRIYLGVHWPSDVLAGWCIGFAWALACWMAARFLSRARLPA